MLQIWQENRNSKITKFIYNIYYPYIFYFFKNFKMINVHNIIINLKIFYFVKYFFNISVVWQSYIISESLKWKFFILVVKYTIYQYLKLFKNY